MPICPWGINLHYCALNKFVKVEIFYMFNFKQTDIKDGVKKFILSLDFIEISEHKTDNNV